MERNDSLAYTESRPLRSQVEGASASGVSWPAVIGGAFVAAALYLILLALGAGLGLSSVSPWSNVGTAAATVGAAAITWLIFSEIVASAMGGYLTGRLRTKWTLIHTDEVYFRDTANGFLAWAVALVVTVAFLASAAASMAGSAVARADNRVAQNASEASVMDTNAYFIDSLFRSERVGPESRDLPTQVEAARIFVHALREDDISASDRTYLARIIAARTGLTIAEADKRVSDALADARQSADATRKATAHLLLWIFLTLLAGAFSASFAATIGGRQRDHVKLV